MRQFLLGTNGDWTADVAPPGGDFPVDRVAAPVEGLRRAFGATLTKAEVSWLREREFAGRAEDPVWHRSMQGLGMSADEIARLDDWMHAGDTAAAPV